MLFRPLVAIAALASSGAYAQDGNSIVVGHGNSDEYASAELVMYANPNSPGVGVQDHARISSILENTRALVDRARVLINNQESLDEGKHMLAKASDMFGEVKDIMLVLNAEIAAAPGEQQQRKVAERKYADHDLQRALEDEERAMDVSRQVYETLVTFPNCIEKFIEDCLVIINQEIGSLGLSAIETLIHEKRNENQGNYNKVVIITNLLADVVVGQGGLGIVEYPYMWNEKAAGALESTPATPKRLGVEGKWNCSELTPEACCQMICDSAKNPDSKGKYIECHIFVPFGGVGNKKRDDRVLINLSDDGRVHEAPVIT